MHVAEEPDIVGERGRDDQGPFGSRLRTFRKAGVDYQAHSAYLHLCKTFYERYHQEQRDRRLQADLGTYGPQASYNVTQDAGNDGPWKGHAINPAGIINVLKRCWITSTNAQREH